MTVQSRRWRTRFRRRRADTTVASRSGTAGTGIRVDDRAQELVARDVLGQRLERQHEPVAQHVERQVEDVLGQRVVAAAHERERARREDEVDRRARAGAEGDVAPRSASPCAAGIARRRRQPDGVLDQRRVDEDLVGLALQREQPVGRQRPAATVGTSPVIRSTITNSSSRSGSRRAPSS